MAEELELAFSAEGLCVGYDRKPLISDIHIAMKKGQILTLIGPNGAGKSTILKSITRHLATLGGAVYIGQDDLRTLNGQALARRLSVVLTERLTPEMMTCRDVIATGRYPYTGRFGLLGSHDNEVVDRCLRLVRAESIADRDFSQISDGQRQRILLARALCQEPQVIVLDEPTSFLDIRHKAELLNILVDMARTQGVTIIMSLHEIDLAAKVSDQVMCVKGDHILCTGTPEEVFTEERVTNLYELENSSYNVLFGSLELRRPVGTPRLFVLAGAGCGIPFFRTLERQRTPFLTGILQENDVDFLVAKALADQVYSVPSFCEASAAVIDEACKGLLTCEALLHTGVPILAGNAYNQRLLDAAEAHHIPIIKELP